MNPVKSNKIFTGNKLQMAGFKSSRIDRAKSVAVISHVNPDGDAIGSSLALWNYLKKKGIDCHVIMPNEYPDFLKWLPGSNNILIFNKDRGTAESIILNADIIFFLDFNSPARAGKIEEFIKQSHALKILIDHHPNPSDFADIIYSDTLSSSTCELVFRFIELIGDLNLVDTDSATCLYTGIMSDTGSFSYNSSQPGTYIVLSELLKRGIDKDFIYSMVYDNFSQGRLRLLGYCLNKKMVVLPDYKTAYMSLTLDEKKQYNYIRGDSEGFVNYPLSIKGIGFAAFFMENNDHIKLSFRSKGKIDSNNFAAKYFDGGGHINASGGESKLSLNDTIAKFVSLLPGYFS